MTDCDFGPAYRYHQRVLKLLQWHRPPSRWRVKTPAHLMSVDALSDTYPEARFFMTHRDNTRVIPSVASVVTAVERMTTGQADALYVGSHCADVWDFSLRHFITFRDRVGDDRFHDIAFDDIQTRPIEAIQGLYNWLGEDLTPTAIEAMRAWLAHNEETRKEVGEHRYEPSDFGLDVEQIRDRFAYYAQRFPIAAPRST
jgi:hypothetical protein